MQDETCCRSQSREWQKIHRLQRQMANRMQFYSSIASIRQSYALEAPLQCLWISDGPSEVKRTSTASLVSTLLCNESQRSEARFQQEQDSHTNTSGSSRCYLKLLLLSRTRRKVRDAKNIKITSDTM